MIAHDLGKALKKLQKIFSLYLRSIFGAETVCSNKNKNKKLQTLGKGDNPMQKTPKTLLELMNSAK